jgi:para-nitrobenzyl esterase
VYQVATDLGGDRFIAYSTWKWLELSAATGGKPVYRYYYSRPRPRMIPGQGTAPAARGASHSAEIEYAMGNLDGNKVYEWTPEDRKVSALMQEYFANFIKTSDPNGAGLPKWPAMKEGSVQFMHIDVESRAEPEAHRGRNLVLDRIASKQ